MGSLSAVDSLQFPVRLHGIKLGQPVDLLVETETWHVLGFVVRCGDDSTRFLPYGACQPGEDEIAVASALMLLEDVGFYRSRGISISSLVGGAVARDGRTAGTLRDLLLGSGHVEELEVERGGAVRRLPAVGSKIAPSRASAA
jgi:hypothetical protein